MRSGATTWEGLVTFSGHIASVARAAYHESPLAAAHPTPTPMRTHLREHSFLIIAGLVLLFAFLRGNGEGTPPAVLEQSAAPFSLPAAGGASAEAGDDLAYLEASLGAGAVESVADGLKRELGNLKIEIGRFGDGYSNWRDVAPRVESSIDRLELRLDRVESEVAYSGLTTDVDALREKLRGARQELDRFRDGSSAWEAVAPGLEREVNRFDARLGDIPNGSGSAGLGEGNQARSEF